MATLIPGHRLTAVVDREAGAGGVEEQQVYLPVEQGRKRSEHLQPVGEQVTATASATSKSAVSRKSVAMTETALA